eukprot:1911337-Rhodomonas_salina.2
MYNVSHALDRTAALDRLLRLLLLRLLRLLLLLLLVHPAVALAVSASQCCVRVRLQIAWARSVPWRTLSLRAARFTEGSIHYAGTVLRGGAYAMLLPRNSRIASARSLYPYPRPSTLDPRP